MKQQNAAESAYDDLREERLKMVELQIAARGIADSRVLEAMRRVPRHEFIPEGYRGEAYGDHPVPIGHDQTISQPYIVAFMTEALKVGPGDRVLEIGTGSGYQAAILAEMDVKVYTIEIIEPLGKRALKTLQQLGYGDRVQARIGDGHAGWADEAPFDGIIVTAAPPELPSPLVKQLAEGGRLVAPVGRFYQELRIYTKKDGAIELLETLPVRFVPMTGKAAEG